MLAENSELVYFELAATLLELENATPDGALLRIDYLSREQARSLASNLEELAADSHQNLDYIWTVVADPAFNKEITYERAVELRNRSGGKLILLVPGGLGVAQSSIDNPFSKLSFGDLIVQTNERLMRELRSDEQIKVALSKLQRWWTANRLNPLQVAEFLVAINPRRSVMWAEHLWILGLVPDLGSDAVDRLQQNMQASKEISRPATQNSPLASRLQKVHLVNKSLEARIETLLADSPLYDSQNWARKILDEGRAELTFENWTFGTATDVELVGLEIKPFINRAGKPERWSRLRASEEDDLLTLPMSGEPGSDATGTLGVKWATVPSAPVGVSNFRVEILPSAMARALGVSDDPIAEEIVGANRRSQTIELTLSPENSHLGDRFVARVSALDESGQVIQLSTASIEGSQDEFAARESEEFRAEVMNFEPETYERKPTAQSLTHARLETNVGGIDVSEPEAYAWDFDNQLVSANFAPGKSFSVQYSNLLLSLEKMSFATPGKLLRFAFSSNGQKRISEDDVAVTSFDAPRPLASARKALFSRLKTEEEDKPLIVAKWDTEFRRAAFAYLASYRRLLENADDEELGALLSMDTFSIEMMTGVGPIKAVIVLPSHPLRLGWVAKYEELIEEWSELLSTFESKARASVIDLSLAKRIAPINFPYVVLDFEGEPFVYHSELTFGSGLYVPLNAGDVEKIIPPVLSALGLPHRPLGDVSVDSLLEKKISEYQDVHPLSTGLSVNAINPGDGAILSSALGRALSDTRSTDGPLDPYPIRVACFAENLSPTDPVPQLQALQREYRTLSYSSAPTFLVPPFSLSCSSVDNIDGMLPSNIGLVQGFSHSRVTGLSVPDRSPLLRGLISPLFSTLESAPQGKLTVVATLKPNPTSSHIELPSAHSSHQLAVGRQLGLSESVPGFTVEIDGSMVENIRQLHEKSDWVVTIDRNAGATTFEELVRPHLPESVLLDYAPDFVDGFSDRVSVTTVHRGEIDLALAQAMDDLGLSTLGRGPKEIVKSLTDISGRLVLRLYQANSMAREAVGLAAVMAYLERKGSLENTLIIPLDAHPDIFGPAIRRGEEQALRCDLMLVRLTRRSFKIELVEVKARKSMNSPDAALNIKIENQVTETQRYLSSTVLPTHLGRVDSEIQWVRAISLLYFYAERAAFAGRMTQEKLLETQALISRLAENPVEPQYSLTGYVVTLDAGKTDENFKRGDVRIRYLTANALSDLGFTTHFEAEVAG